MATTIFLTIYLLACLLVAQYGRDRRMGFIGTFIISLFITPVAMLIILALTGPSPDVEWRRRHEQRSRE